MAGSTAAALRWAPSGWPTGDLSRGICIRLAGWSPPASGRGNVTDAYDLFVIGIASTLVAKEWHLSSRFPSFERAEHEVLHWIGFYNGERLHESLDDVPPAEYEEEHHRLNYKRDNNRMLSAT